MTHNSTLTISRDKGYVDGGRKYTIVVNKKPIGKIANGETKEFELHAGEHEIYLKIDWCRSNKLTIKADEHDTIALNVTSSLRGLRILLGLLYLFVIPNKYLKLYRA